MFGLIVNLQHFYKNKLGITIDTVNTHKHADMGVNRALTAFEKAKINKDWRASAAYELELLEKK